MLRRTRFRMMIRSLIVVAVFAAGGALAEAPAKPNGIKIGDGRLHASLSVRAGYDSAANIVPDMTLNPAKVGDLVFSPLLGLLFNLDTAATSINFNGSGGYVWYPGVINPITRAVSHPTVTAGIDTAFSRTGPVEFQIGDTVSYTNHTANVAAGIGLTALYNTAYVAVPLHPGGGAIVVTPKVRWDIEKFSPLAASQLMDCPNTNITCTPGLVSKMDYSNLNFGLGGKWKFLPKTAVVLDATFDYRFYFNTTPPPPGMTPDTTSNLNAYLLKVTGGLTGLITSRISTLLLIGGAGDWGGSNAKTFIAQAEVAYLGSDFTVRGGYLRTLNPVPVFGTYGQDRGYLEGKAVFIGRLSARAFGSFDYLTFYDNAQRSDYIIGAAAEIGYQFVSFFSAAISYNLSVRGTSSNFTGLNYIRHEPALTLTLAY